MGVTSGLMLMSRMSGLEAQFEIILHCSLQAMATEDDSVALDPYLDEQLNDIDELITSELREPSANDTSEEDFWKNWPKSDSSEEVFVDEPFALAESKNQVSWIIDGKYVFDLFEGHLGIKNDTPYAGT